RAGLVDLRPHSPTYRASQIVELGDESPLGLFIPIGVAHGFYAVTDCTLIYFVNNYYDSTDEYGVAWNDPAIGLDWGADDPLISERDANNPRLDALPADAIPQP
ncbi:MAG: dTDP-4-dehydrorhamnose 3,5-epimerase family protein, partial [Anaerolineae bacterium]|nr:dTDP-4-dehydrorhamnose 3,5-epimerase family protein [Anaerolineae bacterium]